ncbi:MAG: acetolactate synthase small subunit [Bdellovibrionales bacterium]
MSSTDQEKISRHCFAVLVANEPGVLARVIGLFCGRGYNIESLTVDEVDPKQHLSRITIVSCGTPMILAQIEAQLARLVCVREVVNLSTQGQFVESCLAFLKLTSDPKTIKKAIALAKKDGATVAKQTAKTTILQFSAPRKKIDALIKKLRPLGLVETASTGSMAMGTGSKVFGAKRKDT